MRVDGDISDIFFNTAHDASQYETRRGGKKVFVGFDDAKLRSAAEDTLGSLSRLGVAVPTVDDLIADFHGRV